MRLILLNHEFPPVGGGAATATARLAEQLAALGHAVRVVTSGMQEQPAESNWRGAEVVRLADHRRSVQAPGTFELLRFLVQGARRLPGEVRDFRADGVLAFFNLPSGWLAARTLLRAPVPLIVSPRGSDVPGFRGGRLGGTLGCCARPLIRSALGRADLIAPNSRHLAELTVGFMPAAAVKTRVVPNGVVGESVADRPARSESRTLHLVCVGQLIGRKRVDLLLRAVRQLPLNSTRLTIVGDGPHRPRLQRLARRLGLNQSVDFLGWQPRERIAGLLRRHDIYVSASDAEGMSNACLEAMAAGLPVVTTANGSHDLVRESGCGQVVPLGDPAGLAAALRKLNDVAERQRCASAGLQYVRHRTWRRSAEQFVQLFEQVGG